MPFSTPLPAENSDPWDPQMRTYDTNLKAFVDGLETAQSTKVNSSTFTAALANKADLVSGKVPTSQMPPLVVNDTHSVNSQAEMLALAAAQGDVAVRIDTSQLFYLAATPASTLSNWILMSGGTSVTSVAGKTGVVSLIIGDITGLQAALDAKAATTVATTTVAGLIEVATQAEVDAGTAGTLAVTAATLASRLTTFTGTLPELIRDTIAGALVAGTNITITPNDAGDTITIAASGAGGGGITTEDAVDATAAALVGGSNITVTYDDTANTITIAVSGLTKTSVGLANVDNTSDANKPVSTLQAASIATKITAPADPNADRILFWDDSASIWTVLTIGTGLLITGTTLNSTAAAGTATSFDLEMSGGFYNFPATIGTGVIRVNTFGPTAPDDTNIKIAGTASATLPTYIGLGAGKARHEWHWDDRVG